MSELFDCVRRGGLKGVKRFIRSGGDVNAKDDNGYTLLGIACNDCDFEIVKFLVENGADINMKSAGETALLIACREGHFDTVKFLAENGADASIKCDNGWTALMEAVFFENIVTVEFIVEYFGYTDPKDEILCGGLIAAARSGDVEIIKYFLDLGVDINIRDEKTGRTPLLEVFCNEFLTYSVDTAQYLIENGADINAKDSNGNTALIFAAQWGYYDSGMPYFEYLVRNVDDINAKNCVGQTALINASHKGILETVECLIRHGADTSIKDDDGNNAIMTAYKEGRTIVANFLMQYMISTV